MRHLFLIGLALFTPAVAHADVMAPWPIPERVARADVIFVGKVKAIEPATMAMSTYPGQKEKIDSKVAVVEVQEMVSGLGKGKEVRIAFLPPAPRRRAIQFDYAVGKEALFFLTARPDQSIYQTLMYFDVVQRKGNAHFGDEVALSKRCAKLLASPEASLKAKDVKERLLTASLLLMHYRSIPRVLPAQRGQVPIPAALSKQILTVLAEADWTGPNAQREPTSPLALFMKLGLTDKDGWQQPPNFRDTPEAAKKWLKANAGTYRIQRWVIKGVTKGP
jgi:hypothetical protein